MNDLRLEPAPGSSGSVGVASLPEQPSSASGISVFGVIVGLGLLLLFGFFGVILIAVGMRWSRGSVSHSPAMVEMPAAQARGDVSPSTAGEQPRTAVVDSRSLPTGVMHTTPGLDTPRAGFVPKGTTVEVLSTRYIQSKTGPQTWYRVRVVLGGKVYEGWMHSDLLPGISAAP